MDIERVDRARGDAVVRVLVMAVVLRSMCVRPGRLHLVLGLTASEVVLGGVARVLLLVWHDVPAKAHLRTRLQRMRERVQLVLLWGAVALVVQL